MEAKYIAMGLGAVVVIAVAVFAFNFNSEPVVKTITQPMQLSIKVNN